jgi:hypothetical protein
MEPAGRQIDGVLHNGGQGSPCGYPLTRCGRSRERRFRATRGNLPVCAGNSEFYAQCALNLV